MTKVELSEVLRAHQQEVWADDGCSCCSGPTVEYDDCACGFRASERDAHADHLADVVLAWVAEQIPQVLDHHDRTADSSPVDGCICGWQYDETLATYDEHLMTAIRATLGGPGASAGVEVAPGATGELAGAQIAFPQWLPLIGDHRPMWDRGDQLGTTDSGGYCAADEATQCGLADECPPFHCREDRR